MGGAPLDRAEEQMNESLGPALAELADSVFIKAPVKGAQWHGGLWLHVADLSVAQALWRPGPDRHCSWEIVRHVVFWHRYLMAWHARTERPDPAGSWGPLPTPADADAWAQDGAVLRKSFEQLRALFSHVEAAGVLVVNPEGLYGRFIYLVGILNHDSYHTGQVAVLRALQGLPPVE